MLSSLLAGGWVVISHQERNAERQLAAVSDVEAPTPGNIAPDFTLQTTAGEEIQLSQLRGTPVVVNFWASWCGPCRREMPFFQAVSEEYANEVVMLGVNQQESATQVDDFADLFGVTYPLVMDSDGQVSDLYRVFGLPTTLFIDADGVVQDVLPGTVSEAVLQQRIDNLIE